MITILVWLMIDPFSSTCLKFNCISLLPVPRIQIKFFEIFLHHGGQEELTIGQTKAVPRRIWKKLASQLPLEC